MPDFDLESFLNAPHYAYEFKVMIGDIQDYLELSERTIEWQHRAERRAIRRRAEEGEFQKFPLEYRESYREHLETTADHRFKVSLALRIRYGALVALVTAVEWSVKHLAQSAKDKIGGVPPGKNRTVHAIEALAGLAGLDCSGPIKDFEALWRVRNCIAHSAGLERDYGFRDQLPEAIARLDGFSLAEWHFLGSHVAIEKGALDKYIEDMEALVVDLHKKAHERGLFTGDA